MHPPAGRIAGVDFGTVRLGIALTDPGQTLATAHENYTRRGAQADARWFRRLVDEEGIVRWVVSLPVHISGEESQKSHEARQFGRWLAETTGVRVDFFDERYTTAQAEEILLAAELTSKQRKRRRDMLAAQMMLTAYLESSSKGRQEPGPLD